MPLNDYPSAKPTYDFYDTGPRAGPCSPTACWKEPPPPRGRQFPGGSVTWHWHSAAPVASYLVENSVGRFDLTERTTSGMSFYQAQASSLSAAGRPPTGRSWTSSRTSPGSRASSAGRTRSPRTAWSSAGLRHLRGGDADDDHVRGRHDRLDTFYHENMHQWWGDHVTESGYQMTFFKEGLATLGEFLFPARKAQGKAEGGVPGGPPGLPSEPDTTFASIYAARTASGRWPRPTRRPGGCSRVVDLRPARHRLPRAAADPRPRGLLARAGADPAPYGDASISEPQLEAEFAR